jgi:hypothetical protein
VTAEPIARRNVDPIVVNSGVTSEMTSAKTSAESRGRIRKATSAKTSAETAVRPDGRISGPVATTRKASRDRSSPARPRRAVLRTAPQTPRPVASARRRKLPMPTDRTK